MFRKNFAIYVSNDFVTKKKIFRINHDDLETNHFARSKIEIAIRRKYYWINMIKNIAIYCKIYSNCQKMRMHYHKLYEKLFLISSRNCESFTIVTLDFITNLLFVKKFYTKKINDSILILINKLIKYAIYVAIIKNLNVENFVNLMWREFVSQYNIIRELIFDRESLFTNYFWFTMCWHLNAKRKLSIIFYSQTNN